MKPEDLKSPFCWDERSILIQDRVWYVPAQFQAFETFQFPGWNHPEMFADSRPVKIEYCSGNGRWVAARAQGDPDHNWVAVEQKFGRVRKIWSKIKNLTLPNLLAICGEATTVTSHYFPSESVTEVFVNFPDPWPKRRHSKYRLLQGLFLQDVRRILVPNGAIMVVTDDPAYSKQVIGEFQKTPGFISSYPDPFYTHECSGYGSSYFEDLWRGKGKAIYYHRFQKVDLEPA